LELWSGISAYETWALARRKVRPPKSRSVAVARRARCRIKTPLALENIERFLAGERPERLFNPEVWEQGRARAQLARAAAR
jgi:hypothetical protein